MKEYIIQLIDERTKWRSLRLLQSNSFIKSTYIWIIIVPITAKLFSKIDRDFSFLVNNVVYTIDLHLPFSWKYFFLSSLFFVIANILFILRSPKIIKDFEDYGDFEKKGESSSYLNRYNWKEYSSMLSKSKAVEQEKDETENILELHNQHFGVGDTLSESPKKSFSSYEKGKLQQEEFWRVYKYYDSNINIKSRMVCAFFYFLGGILFFWVVLSNISWALKYIILNTN